MYDPTIGQFISEDPIKFEAGDPNLRRYVANSPPNATDPSGLEAAVVVYIDETSMPPNFNAAKVKALIEQILKNAGVSVNIVLTPTTQSSDQLNLGFEYDWISWWKGAGWWNVNPFSMVVSTVHDVCGAFAKDKVFYNHYLYFFSAEKASWIAQTIDYKTKINLEGIAKGGFGKSINWDVLYANILIHEIFYLGLLGQWDDPSAEPGSIASPTTVVGALMTIDEYWANEIKDALECSE